MFSKWQKALYVYKNEGFGGLANRVLNRQSKLKSPVLPNWLLQLPIRPQDIVDSAYLEPEQRKYLNKVTGKKIAWITSLPSPGSGGHQNLFRFIKFAEDAGYICNIFFYVKDETVVNVQDMKLMLSKSGGYPSLSASMQMYSKDSSFLCEHDVIFSSSWETAYASRLCQSGAKRLYFVQDFEPWFYPSGSVQLFAEETYRFGFTAITAGKWLAHKLQKEYGMTTYSFDFAVDANNYFLVNYSDRKSVFFYARPSTPRRGFELGILVLSELKRLRPDINIHFAGEAFSKKDVPFEFESHGILSVDQLRALYNRCAAALVISTTNLSLLPLELLACGVVPVVNDAENNVMVSSNKHIKYVSPSPSEMAQEIIKICDATHSENQILERSMSSSSFTWEDSGSQFLAALDKCLYD